MQPSTVALNTKPNSRALYNRTSPSLFQVCYQPPSTPHTLTLVQHLIGQAKASRFFKNLSNFSRGKNSSDMRPCNNNSQLKPCLPQPALVTWRTSLKLFVNRLYTVAKLEVQRSLRLRHHSNHREAKLPSPLTTIVFILMNLSKRSCRVRNSKPAVGAFTRQPRRN